MTFRVEFTDYADFDSTFVDQAWYNSNNNRLVLDLNDTVYEYYDVQKAVFDDLKNASSAGTFYRNNIKGRRHGTRLGDIYDLEEVRVAPKGVFRPNEVRFGDGGYIKSNGDAHFPLANPEKVHVSGSSITVTDPTKIQKFSLAVQPESSEAPKFDYTLQFVVVSGQDASPERSHTLQASSLDDAIEQFLDLAAKLDQNVLLKGASVRFE